MKNKMGISDEGFNRIARGIEMNWGGPDYDEEEEYKFLITKEEKNGTLFWHGSGWSDEYPDAKIFRDWEKADAIAQKVGGDVIADEDYRREGSNRGSK